MARPAQAQPVTTSVSSQLKVLSWNIFMLPRLIAKTGQHKRAAIIAEQLKDAEYDMIVFQEAFGSKTRKILWDILQECFPYQAGPVNIGTSSFRLNGGVWIVSRLPMELLGEIEFDDCKSWDCMSRKGAMLVQVEKGGKKYQVMGTHLQADESVKRDEIRRNQCVAIRDQLLLPHASDSVPQLLCGDFNISENNTERYDELLDILQASNDNKQAANNRINTISPLPQFTYNWEENDLIESDYEVTTLDYILLRKQFKPFKAISRTIKVFTGKWSADKHKNKRNLSDHHAVEITLIPE